MRPQITILTVLLSACCATQSQSAVSADRPLRAEVERLSSIAEIQNVMSRHAWYYAAGEHQRELDEIWARQAADISWGSDEGWWVGRPLLQEYYVAYFDRFRARDLKDFVKLHPDVAVTPANLGAGTSLMHTNSTPLIEVAADGRTAKGMWYAIGQVTQTPGGQQTPMYMWERYAVDFLNEDGHWKIWHFFVHTDWSAAPGESWVRAGGIATGPPPGGGQAGESGGAPPPTVKAVPAKQDASYAPPAEFPRVPVPYRTFNQTFSYGPPSRR
jgi:hypothetical protein